MHHRKPDDGLWLLFQPVEEWTDGDGISEMDGCEAGTHGGFDVGATEGGRFADETGNLQKEEVNGSNITQNGKPRAILIG